MKIVMRISALFIGLALMVALPVTAHASTNDDQQDIASLDMSVIDVQIQSRGVMTAEDLYDFLQSDAEKTVDIDAETGKITALAFNYPEEYEIAVPSAKNFSNYMDASSKKLNMSLEGLKPGATFIVETLDKNHGNVYDDYVEIGAPHSPTREDIAYLKQKAWETKKETLRVDENGTLTLNCELLPWTCVLIKEL